MTKGYRYELAKQRKQEIEQPKGGDKENATRHKAVSSPPLKRKCGSITGRAIWKAEFTIVTLAKTLNITYLFQKMIRNPMTRQGLHV